MKTNSLEGKGSKLVSLVWYHKGKDKFREKNSCVRQ